jgi:hypothetical protein
MVVMQPGEPEDTVLRPRGRVAADPGLLDDDTIIRVFPLVEPGTSTPGIAARGTATPPLAQPVRDPFRRVRVNAHDPFSLETPVLVGRKPAAPRIVGAMLPRLIPVPSPSREVSATHVELRQHGTSVVVTDLNSTNGTRVSIPGSAPLKLRQGESVVVSAGSIVDIGDGNLIEILP